MKLPDDPKERKKLYVAIVFISCAVLYGLYIGVVTPMRNNKAATVDSAAELKQQIHSAQVLIERIDKLKASDGRVVDEIVATAIRSPDLIVPRLGNYLLSARGTVEGAAGRSDLTLDACTEVGHSQIPQHAGRKTENALRSYTVRLGLRSGAYQLLDLIRELETANPYLSVRAISITAQPGSPEEHQVALDVQWPTWADVNLREDFLNEVKSREGEEVQSK